MTFALALLNRQVQLLLASIIQLPSGHCPHSNKVKKSKAITVQACTEPEGSRRLRRPRFHENRHMKVVSLSALRTGRFYSLPPSPQEMKYSWYSFVSRPQAGRLCQ
jgi:hypothetical protein